MFIHFSLRIAILLLRFKIARQFLQKKDACVRASLKFVLALALDI